MSKVVALVALGVGLIGAGFFYQLFDDVINTYITPYIRPSIYNTGEAFLWDMIPWLLVFIGIICLILAGILKGSNKTMVVNE